MRVMSDFDKKTMLLAKLMSENEYLAPVPAAMRNPRVVFREYAELHFKPEPPELVDAYRHLEQAIREATECAEKLQNAYRRMSARNRAAKWHGRSWGRKEW